MLKRLLFCVIQSRTIIHTDNVFGNTAGSPCVEQFPLSLFKRENCLNGLESAFQTIFPGGRIAMVDGLLRKLTMLESSLPSDYSIPSMPDLPIIPSGPIIPKKRQPKRHRTHLRSKKRAVAPPPMSRNSIVNQFMKLDSTSRADERADQDAFVDLEDFLVEG